MPEIILAAVILFGIALSIAVVRSGFRTRRLQRALERGERTPELEAVLAEARQRGRARAHLVAPSEFGKALGKLNDEVSEVTRQGRFDEAARQRFDQQFNEVLAQEQRDLDHRIAEIKSGPPMTPLKWLAFSGVMAIMIGALLHIYLGQHFVPAHSHTLGAASTAFAVCSLPFLAVYLFRTLRSERAVEKHGPMRRWIILFPGGLLFGGTMLMMFASGYIAVAGWLIGSPAAVEGTVIELSERGSAKGCHRFAELNAGTGSAEICTDGKLPDGPLQQGQAVVIEGQASRLGVYVERIRWNRKTTQ